MTCSRYLAKVCYDGSKFQGFQRLNNGKGVQNELERVVSLINGKPTKVKGASRTDALVSAWGQYIHFDLEVDITLDKLKYAMNRLLNDYVSIVSIAKVSFDFHARFNAKNKTYLYKVYVGEKNPFLSDYVYYCYNDLSLEKMSDASKLFIGKHNLHNFTSGIRENYETEIYEIDIKKESDFYLFEVKGKSFYRYMVRSIVGALLDIGIGKRDILELKKAITDENVITFTVLPAQGLTLKDIEY